MKRWQILLCGSGGQGLGLAGKILATAALYDGLYAVQSQSYGARARGGYSASGVVINNRNIYFPLIEQPNLLLVLTEEAYQKNVTPGHDVEHIIFDSDYVPLAPGQQKYGLPLARWAGELDNPKGVAILSLGVITALFGLVTPENVERAIAENIAPALLEANLRCYRKGMEVGGSEKYTFSPLKNLN
ncbi:2-oxoacid:acceptor oxidoreductase family protein [Desulfallas thermosapovorans]|uniref:2-oxoglutarate ferredoxin oxidoreductase subunit gamma n=1 Tax=Desulfallas thermosapovorans DSM 6562 TaxID=1121431 RepID=A0A5S4ZUJ4_9FIRM|nr:2-oxoacid:acceptor oxidoreductase family protein [Desulfallas thermosapovorans]TYO96472.1 2-oxoglutarate ferredoxin oxidoreductase subunit gamma [Desulfallas thermosapovorans DSM 6562]